MFILAFWRAENSNSAHLSTGFIKSMILDILVIRNICKDQIFLIENSDC